MCVHSVMDSYFSPLARRERETGPKSSAQKGLSKARKVVMLRGNRHEIYNGVKEWPDPERAGDARRTPGEASVTHFGHDTGLQKLSKARYQAVGRASAHFRASG